MAADTVTAPCEGCGELVGPVHRCHVCSRHMHPFCGRAVGEEGFGQAIRCPQCDRTNSIATTVSSLPGQGPNSVELSDSCENEDEMTTYTSIAPPASKRHTQVVTSIANRRKVVRWLLAYEQKNGTDGMYAKAVDRVSDIFNSATWAANLQKAMDWWRKRERVMGGKRGQIVISARRAAGRRRSSTKVIGGRGRSRSPWVEWLYPRLLDGLDRLRKLGVKFEPPLLLQLAKQILRDSTEDYNARSVDVKGALIIDKITSRWVQTFMEAHQIVLRTQSGKKQLSEAKILHIEKSVAFHLGELRRGFAGGSLDEDTVENMDETHFVVDFDDDKTLGFSGEKQIKYDDVVSGGEGMTMVVRLSGGASAQIFPR